MESSIDNEVNDGQSYLVDDNNESKMTPNYIYSPSKNVLSKANLSPYINREKQSTLGQPILKHRKNDKVYYK